MLLFKQRDMMYGFISRFKRALSFSRNGEIWGKASLIPVLILWKRSPTHFQVANWESNSEIPRIRTLIAPRTTLSTNT